MNEVEIMDRRDERHSALDAFARANEPSPSQNAMTIPAGGFPTAAERVFGAQAVAVHRDEGRVLQKLKALASAAGDDWYYRFPVKNKKTGRTDYIEGPSIKLANDLARLYGNCEIETKVMDLGDSWIIYARFTDYETGFALTRPFQQRKSGSRLGGDDDGRRLEIAMSIGVSKASRNVIVNALQTFADFAFEEAKNALVDKIGKRLVDYRITTARKLEEKLDIRRVEAVVGRASADWLAPDIARIIAMMKAVSDGMATLDETFPPLRSEEQVEEKKDTALQDFAAAEGDDVPAGASEEAGPADGDGAGPASSFDPADDPDSPRAQLLARLRAKAEKGPRALKLALNGLPAEDRTLLGDADVEALTALAERPPTL